MGIKEMARSKINVFRMPIGSIVFQAGMNPREDFSHVDDLAQSIIRYGQLEPIKIQPSPEGGIVYGVHGESRYRAILLANERYNANIDFIDCMVCSRTYTRRDIILEHFERGSTNKPLTAIELGIVYKCFKEEDGQSVPEISEQCRRSEQHIYDHLTLLEAPPEILELVRSGQMSATAAIEIVKAPEGKREKLLKQLQDDEKYPEGAKITGKDVETALTGHPKQVSAKTILKYVQRCNTRIVACRAGSKELEKWLGVKYGLETTLGLHDDDWKSEDE